MESTETEWYPNQKKRYIPIGIVVKICDADILVWIAEPKKRSKYLWHSHSDTNFIAFYSMQIVSFHSGLLLSDWQWWCMLPLLMIFVGELYVQSMIVCQLIFFHNTSTQTDRLE